jgi:hypothetical protein
MWNTHLYFTRNFQLRSVYSLSGNLSADDKRTVLALVLLPCHGFELCAVFLMSMAANKSEM